jgi:hypothetical protein
MHRGSSISVASDKEIKEIECSLTIPEEDGEEDEEDGQDEGGVELSKAERKIEVDGKGDETDQVGKGLESLKLGKSEETK